MGAVQEVAEWRDGGGKAHVRGGKELQLLEAPDGGRPHHGVGMLLDDGAAGQTHAPRGSHGWGGVLELRAERGDEGIEALAQTLVDVHAGEGGNGD